MEIEAPSWNISPSGGTYVPKVLRVVFTHLVGPPSLVKCCDMTCKIEHSHFTASFMFPLAVIILKVVEHSNIGIVREAIRQIVIFFHLASLSNFVV